MLINEQKDLPLDSIPLSTLFITLIICLVLSAYFSGSETGLLSLNKYRLRFMAEQGNRGAQKAEKLLEKPDTLLSFILIFNNLVNISASAIATMIGMRNEEDYLITEDGARLLGKKVPFTTER